MDQLTSLPLIARSIADVPSKMIHFNAAWSKYFKEHSWWWAAGKSPGSWCLTGLCDRGREEASSPDEDRWRG